MNRRRFLGCCGASVPLLLSGCVRPPGTGNGSSDVSVEIVSRDDQPEAPVEYAVEAVEPLATDEHPARLRVSITNRSDAAVVVGEERAVQFHHVASEDRALYLHPAGEGAGDAPVEPGCWRLTEHVGVPEYYGTVALDPGESVRGESYVYGHPDLPADACLPAGDHRVRTQGSGGDDEEAVAGGEGGTAFEWGFTLRLAE